VVRETCGTHAAEESVPDMGGFSIWHLLLLLLVAMLVFGAGRVSEMGKGLGEGIRNFKKGLRDDEDDPGHRARPAPVEGQDEADDDVEVKVVRVKKLPPAAAAPKKKRVIEVEVDDDADDEEIARRIAAKKKALVEDEKST
jgi:sec-independent protein translocase protein TatA